ncbi:hypothetical protein V6N12_009083 [Hibiscus sabdariffa]|uniref:Uncharacterized protein n=1 Tax=Hibiscus sabdariffa TaxID=183260 RepID=A0ABR2C509_9ROSI
MLVESEAFVPSPQGNLGTSTAHFSIPFLPHDRTDPSWKIYHTTPSQPEGWRGDFAVSISRRSTPKL